MIGSALRRRFGLLAGLAAACATCLLVLSPGVAGASDTTGGACANDVSQPFLPWLDPGRYFLAPAGGFEAGAYGWALTGGAAVVGGNEPWHLAGAADSHALSLPVGARATSPAMCIGLVDPTLRFFVRNTSLLGLGTLLVSADVSAGGISVRAPIGLVEAGKAFAPSLPLPVLANLTAGLPLLGTGQVRLTFTAVTGSWQIDDLYVDPFKIS